LVVKPPCWFWFTDLIAAKKRRGHKKAKASFLLRLLCLIAARPRPVKINGNPPSCEGVHLDTVLTARRCSADFQSAVSPICNRQRAAALMTVGLSSPRGLQIRDTADYKSALPQEQCQDAPVLISNWRGRRGGGFSRPHLKKADGCPFVLMN
jgi:hypothetical protein